MWVVLSPGWLFTEGMMMARDLVGWEVVLGLRGLLVEESESWESCTVTQLITLVLWLVPELRERRREEFSAESNLSFTSFKLYRQEMSSPGSRELPVVLIL